MREILSHGTVDGGGNVETDQARFIGLRALKLPEVRLIQWQRTPPDSISLLQDAFFHEVLPQKGKLRG